MKNKESKFDVILKMYCVEFQFEEEIINEIEGKEEKKQVEQKNYCK